MSQDPPKRHKVDISILENIHRPIGTYLIKIDSLLQDHYKSNFILGRTSMLTLMELKISCEVVISYIEDLLAQAEEACVEELYLEGPEIKMISTIATSIRAASAVQLENTNLLEN
jgi:hypothetical protein